MSNNENGGGCNVRHVLRDNESHHNARVPRHQWPQKEKKNSNFTKKEPKKDMNFNKNVIKIETNTY